MNIVQLIMIVSGSGTTANKIWEATLPGGLLYGLVVIRAIVATRLCEAKQLLAANDFPMGKFITLEYTKDDAESWGATLIRLLQTYGATALGLHGCLVTIPESVVDWCREHGVFCRNQHPAHPRIAGGHGWYGDRVFAFHVQLARLLDRPITASVVSQDIDPIVDEGAVYHFGTGLIEPWSDVPLKEAIKRAKAVLLPIEYPTHVEAWAKVARGELELVDPPSPVTPAEEWAIEEARRQVRHHFKF